MVEKREEGREVRVMRGEDGEGSSHCPPVVAVPLLDTAFRSEALERRSLLQEPMMGDSAILTKSSKKGPVPSLCPFVRLSALVFSSKNMHSMVFLELGASSSG